MAFSSDMAKFAETDSRIEYVVPKEGGGLWVDYTMAMAASSNLELAMAFLNYTHKPQVHARLAMFTGAMPTNPAAEKLLPAKMRANRTVFPDAQTLARSEEDKSSPAHIVKLRNNIFSKVVRRQR
jgi:spermidine/putrescine transport system substrate-binding protein